MAIRLGAPQVELVRDILASVGRGDATARGACVKQMLMGGGKTTVVSPLLTLILGDGKHLVLQVGSSDDEVHTETASSTTKR